ncbi:hypothetical protein BDW59DRAFT_120732 [Aspergillus cavernicola]|uniref:Uncharacterized protein n=1 Tax=Aspergillus cavernicola TaxID=176166 RepID=A0ABR4HVM7_9EURO
MNDRSDTSILKAANPALCALYENLRLEVNTSVESNTPQWIGEDVPTRRLTALGELERCLQDIRQLPGFRFLSTEPHCGANEKCFY